MLSMVIRVIFVFSVLDTAYSTFECYCSSCTAGSSYFPSYPRTQCSTVSGTWADDGVSTGTCSNIDCDYYGVISCSSICASCGSGVLSNNDCIQDVNNTMSNSGDCSNKVFYNCVESVSDANGDWSYCNMCMCEKYESYGGNGDCSANDILYACYISDSGCKTQLRKMWIAIFATMSIVACCCIVSCILVLFRRKSAPVMQ